MNHNTYKTCTSDFRTSFPTTTRKTLRAGITANAIGLTLALAFLSASLAGAATPPSCAPREPGGPVWVDATCTDTQFASPVIDSTISVTTPYVAQLVSGHFDGTTATFKIYLPPKASWRGRFFQNVYPIGDGNAAPENVAFSFETGGYVVQTGGTIGYRGDAAAAKFARTVAAQYYGLTPSTIRGYIWGGSGGSYQTVGAVENTQDVWQGAVPFVIGAPTSIPNNFFVRSLAKLVLRQKAAAIADAVRPGGSGNPYSTLNPVEAAILAEVSQLGVPLRAWDDIGYLFGDGVGLLGFGSTIRAIDPTYADDFWSLSGYAGTEVSPLGDLVRATRINVIATASNIELDQNGFPATIVLGGVPQIDNLSDVEATLLNASGAAIGPLNGTLNGTTGRFTLKLGDTTDARGSLKPGMSIRVDNRWSLALAFYHRHQVPTDRTLTAWGQFRRADGSPIYPQRRIQAGPLITNNVTGGATYTGQLTMKTILVGNALDADAFPWQVDWYAKRVQSALGKQTKDMFRVWINDNADHLTRNAVIGSGIPSIPRATRLIEYRGVLYQALRDLVDWVEESKLPAQSTAYSISGQQVFLRAPVGLRGGVQPLVTLRANGRGRVEVRVGEKVQLNGLILAAPAGGKVVHAAWDIKGTGEFEPATIGKNSNKAEHITRTISFGAPGVYYVTLWGATQREGYPSELNLLENIDRVRIVVHANKKIPRKPFD